MRNTNINEAATAARRFLKRIAEYNERTTAGFTCDFSPCKERAAIRRASMDLSRALSKMRQEV